MSKQLFTAYWSGGEPTGPGHSPTLSETPDYVDVVELFEVGINTDGTLNAGTLTQYNSQAVIMGWMKERGTGLPDGTFTRTIHENLP